MTPELSPSIYPSGADEKFAASFRRGRRFVLLLAVLTGGYLLSSSLHGYLTGKDPGGWFNLLVTCALEWWFCWCLFRGGRLASGCLLLVASPLLVVLGFALLAVCSNFMIPKEIGADWKSTLAFLPFAAWGAYAFWVLLISKDARLYREVQRQGIAEKEARSFEWPPASRRQG